MKSLYSTMISIVALVIFLPMGALAAPPSFPSWSQELTKNRFTVLTAFGSAAVLDNETGLVWEQSPSMSTFDWLQAQKHCNKLIVGNRLGWRLPTIQELASLVDPMQSNPALPLGNPFNIPLSSTYWSATTAADVVPGTDTAWAVFFVNGFVGVSGKTGSVLAWCVRGGQGVDPQ